MSKPHTHFEYDERARACFAAVDQFKSTLPRDANVLKIAVDAHGWLIRKLVTEGKYWAAKGEFARTGTKPPTTYHRGLIMTTVAPLPTIPDGEWQRRAKAAEKRLADYERFLRVHGVVTEAIPSEGSQDDN